MEERQTIEVIMKNTILIAFLLMNVLALKAQIYTTRNGFAGFYSKTPFEDIKAENKQVYAGIDVGQKRLGSLPKHLSPTLHDSLVARHRKTRGSLRDRLPS